jgi:excisionase family DNA binding protein
MDLLLTTSEAARELQISVRRVRQLCEAGTLPFRKIGHQLLIERISLEKCRNRRGRGRPAGIPSTFRGVPNAERTSKNS